MEDTLKDIDVEGIAAHFQSQRNDRQFIWQTLRNDERMLNRVAMWSWLAQPAEAAGNGEVTVGLARVGAVVRVGDALNGPPNLVHGGCSAALLDDLFAWCVFREREAQGLPKDTRILTANLNVNYKRPVPENAVYYIKIATERIEKQKKVFLTATLYDKNGHACVEAKCLYIILKPRPQPG